MKTPPPHPRPYVNLKPWQPGQSRNPNGGRTPLLAMASQVRQASGNGGELVEFFVRVLRGDALPARSGRRRHYPSLNQRIEAAMWVADRGWGRAREVIELAGESTPEERLRILQRMSEDDRAALRAILLLAMETPASSAPLTRVAEPTPSAPPLPQDTPAPGP
jgi:hypothetical protein